MRILGISGSLRSQSGNSKLLAVAKALAPPGVEFEIAASLGDLPHFNPDVETDSSPVLRSWIALVKASDGIVISSPEYARGYPGTLKNALDWLVQTDAHVSKPFMMLNASARSTVGRDTLITVLETMSGIHIDQASITVSMLGMSVSVSELKNTDEVVAKIRNSLELFVVEIRRLRLAHNV